MKPEIRERIEKIRKGEVPEGYKKTKVGIIPLNWDVEKLSKFGDVVSGGTPDTEKRSYWGGDLVWVTPSDLSTLKSKFLFNSSKHITEEGLKNSSAKQLPKHSLIVCTRATIGTCVINKVECSTNQGFKNIILNNSDSVEYLYYQIQNNENNLKILGCGSTFLEVSKTDFGKFLIPSPNVKERQKIAEILSTWDKAIELKEKLIEEKKKLRIAIVTDLLFGLKRFDEFIKSHNYNQTRYINIPEDWDFIEIGEIATEVSEKNGNHDDLPVLSCTKYEGLVDSLSYFKRQVFSEDTSTYKQVKKNHFVYATNHIDEGSIGCQNLYENSLVSPMYTVFKTNSKVNNHFLFNLLKTRLYIFIYQVNMSASVDRRGSLRWNEFSKIRIPLPDIAEQNKIVEFIRLVDSDIELLKSELNQLQEQKRGLMQLLLTGIVRVEVD